MMVRRGEILEKILEVVRESVFGITFEELVRKTGHHRMTVRKYVKLLEELGFVVTRKIGYYTLIFPTSVYNCIKYDFPGLYLDSLLYVLTNKFGFDKKRIFELSKNVAKVFMEQIHNIVRKAILKLQPKIEELTDIMIPTVASHLKFKIRSFSTTDKLLYLEIHNAKVIKSSIDITCEFLRGYIAGVLESLGINYKNIVVLEKSKVNNSVSCILIIILEEPIHVIREKLELINK